MSFKLSGRAEEYLKYAAGIIVVIDRNQQVCFINKNGCSLLQSKEAEILGRNWFDNFVTTEDRESHRKLFFKIINHQPFGSPHTESVLVTGKNNLLLIKWYNYLLTEHENEILGMLCIGEDITEKKMLLQRISFMEETSKKRLVTAVLDAQEKERREIALELHDNVNQMLTTCKLLLGQEAHNGNPSPFINNTIGYLQNAIEEIRNISHRLNPSHLEDVGLEQAIKDMAHKINLSNKLVVHVAIYDEDHLNMLTPELKLCIFRIIQEQLSNVMKHAHAGMVDINLNATETAIEFEVKDNGKGFDLKKATRGLGLRSIYSRVDLYGGQVYINTEPGDGCTLSVHIPTTEHQA